MPRENKKAWKTSYFERLSQCFDNYSKGFLVSVDNVGSTQMQRTRSSLRGSAVIVMGKNTMMRKVISDKLNTAPHLESLLPKIVGNVGIVFTTEDLKSVRDIIVANKVKAPARVGTVAPLDVFVPAQTTNLGPEKTSFFQAVSISTKITRGMVEITNLVHLIREGAKVGSSEATLLSMLGIWPFSYGMVVKHVFDSGAIFSPSLLDITSDDLLASFRKGINNVAAVSLSIGVPTAASAPHILANSFKNLLAIAAATDITFPQAQTVKDFLADPSKFSAAAPPAAAAAAAAPATAAAPVETKKVEESEESDDAGFDSLFG